MEDAAIFDRATSTTTYRVDGRSFTRQEALSYLISRAMTPADAREKLSSLPVEDSASQPPK